MKKQEHEENKQTLTEEQRKEKVQMDHEEEQKKRIEKFVIGGSDLIGNTIQRIFSKGDDFVIYDVSGVSLIESMKVFISEKKKGDIEPEKNYQQIKDEFDKFKSVLYKTNADLSYKCRAANAISVAISGNKDVGMAKSLLQKITEEALTEYKDNQQGRLWYLCGAIISTIMATILGLIAYICRASDFAQYNQGLIIFCYSSVFSTFGGLLSVSINLKNVSIEKALNNPMYAIYGSQRLLFSILGGIAVVLLVKSKMFFGDLMSGDKNLYALMAICYLSGFSETLVPNALKNLEGKAKK